ncbi:sugar ABC transporter substrate-binding protein [Streptomyces sulfonofaciens]|uniref:Sugar ABC transporter substrate-binding protein n=1 Tax=Streptomyces sulfonofaciens TaxID=68272 RepID=A0A919G6U5_9ACTN|nr:extracellular solute-binding protein [Streptomyces sulfonofaciens]GHH79100.1 sugar ABC transporter substrate-binding protein [Streptomyces sulfonofaciens]
MHTARWRYAIAALPVMALALTGCGGSGGDKADSDNKLTVWMMTGGPGDSPLIKDVNAEFAKKYGKKYPGMKVDVQVQQWDGVATKITTALATSNPPDIVEMGNTQTPLQTYSGGLADLTAAKKSFEGSAGWLSGLSGPSTYDGKLYAVPLYGGTKVVMYNKKMFADAGIKQLPKTIGELQRDCGTLAKANSGTANFSGFYMPGQYWFNGIPFAFAKGGTVATEKGGKWRAEMSSPANQAGLKAWRTFQNTCSTKSSVGVNTDSPDQDQLFADGKAAMEYVKAWEPATVLEKNPGLKDRIGFFALPGYTADRTMPVIVSGSTIGVAANSPDKKAATDWLRIIAGKDFQQSMAKKLNLLPISPAFTPPGVPEQLTVASEASKISQPLPNSPGEATLETERYNEQFFSKIAGGADIATASAAYDKHATKAFNSLGD